MNPSITLTATPNAMALLNTIQGPAMGPNGTVKKWSITWGDDGIPAQPVNYGVNVKIVITVKTTAPGQAQVVSVLSPEYFVTVVDR